MPESHPDSLALQGVALKYAAGDLPPPEAAAFEARLAVDQHARDALAEAIRLSAAALGQAPPAPDRSIRGLIRDRLLPLSGWCARWLPRRAYRGHPAVWAGIGAGVVAASTLVALHLVAPDGATSPAPALAAEPAVAHPALSPWEVMSASVAQSQHEGSDLAQTPGDAASCDGADTTLRAAEFWADLSTPDQVERNHDEEMRFRNLLRDHPVLLPARWSPDAAEVRDP